MMSISSSGIVSHDIGKMNSKPMEAADLKKFDRQEKEVILAANHSVKGKMDNLFPTYTVLLR